MLRLGWAAGRVLGGGSGGKVVIGKDTRISGYMLESALEAGLAAAGGDIHLLGPMPTPGIAYLTRTLHADAGIVISASHNPYYDNGIKFFSGDGYKLPDQVEAAIEAELERPVSCVGAAALGKAFRVGDAAGRYIEYCKSSIPWDTSFNGLKLVVDCANGATYHIAPFVLRELGAEVVAIGDQPDGLNINEGVGSTHVETLREAVLAHQADMGVALDGDGDRLIMVDHLGRAVDGDHILYTIAQSRLADAGRLPRVVGTLMTNLGLEHALEAQGIGLERTKVGDRYIMERLKETDGLLGGEPSGHIICLDRTTTGDGVVSALQVLHALKRSGETLAQMRDKVVMYPQILKNVQVAQAGEIMAHAELTRAVAAAEARLAGRGRVLLRPSGTEPLLRVMVEGEDGELVEALAEELAEKVRSLA
jgi:phosphoglucosamine mutase